MVIFTGSSTVQVGIFLLGFLQHYTVQSLPDKCVLSGDNQVTCSELQTFPVPFVTNATSVTIQNSDLTEIPSGAFKDFSNVQNLSFHDLQIGTIKGCAFSDLTLTELSIYNGQIQTIENYAFSDIIGTAAMSIYYVIVGDIHSYAFNNISGFDTFSMYGTNITNLHSYAFNKIQLTTKLSLHDSNIHSVAAGAFQTISPAVSITSNQIGILGCHTFDKLNADLTSSFELQRIRFNCDCNLHWFVQILNNSASFSPTEMVCYLPESQKDNVITEISNIDLCAATPTTCDTNDVTPPDVTNPCNGVSSRFIANVFLLMLFVLTANLKLL